MLNRAVGGEQLISKGTVNVTDPYGITVIGTYALTPTRMLWCCERDDARSVEGFAFSWVRNFRLLRSGLRSQLEVTFAAADQVLRLSVMPWDGRPKEPGPTLDYLMEAMRTHGADRFDTGPMRGWSR
jgi:hypothetical protein